jgi:transposase
MWTRETRAEHDRDDLRYPSDLTDAEWRVLAPLLPPPAETGRHRPMRELMNAIFFVLRGGCPWRMLPEHFPPHQTAYRWFIRFRDDGTWESLNHHLVMMDRERVGREASPSAAVIDSQSVKTTEAGGPRGYDAGKKINGRKRQVMVDTDGRGVILQVHQPQSRIGMAQSICCGLHDRCCHSSSGSSPIALMPPNAWQTRPGSSSRSCASRSDKSALPYIPGAGSSNASLPGSGATAGCKGFRGYHRLRNRLPLRCFGPAPHATTRSFGLRFESDSKSLATVGGIGWPRVDSWATRSTSTGAAVFLRTANLSGAECAAGRTPAGQRGTT